METLNKKILIAIPTNAGIKPDTFRSIYNMEVPDGYETHFEYFFGYQIDQIRNLIAEWAKNFDYLFSIDSDIVVPPDALKKMLAVDKDAVSGVYIQRFYDKQTTELYYTTEQGQMNYEVNELPQNVLLEVDAFGMGCALIKGEVFRNIEYPHFVYSSALDHANTVSEDVYFCAKAKSKGFRLFADTSIICGHIGHHDFKVDVESMQVVAVATTPEMSKVAVEIPLKHPEIEEAGEEEAIKTIIYDVVGTDLYEAHDDGVEMMEQGFYPEGLDHVIARFRHRYPNHWRLSTQYLMEILSGATTWLENCSEITTRITNDYPETDNSIQYIIDKGFEYQGVIGESENDKDHHFIKR